MIFFYTLLILLLWRYLSLSWLDNKFFWILVNIQVVQWQSPGWATQPLVKANMSTVWKSIQIAKKCVRIKWYFFILFDYFNWLLENLVELNHENSNIEIMKKILDNFSVASHMKTPCITLCQLMFILIELTSTLYTGDWLEYCLWCKT